MNTLLWPRRAGPRLGTILCLLATTAAGADGTSMQRCRAIGDASARLACYDSLALPPGAASPVRTAPQPQVAGPAAATAAAMAPPVVQNFGQERRDEPQAISSHIVDVFEGWDPTSRIKLANGQVWQVMDGSEGVYFLQNPKVTVRRALMGGFQLDIEGAKRTPRVRRVE